jgi:dipeptidyl aminopeptidase/acylaminoacyl peptidase
MRTLVHTVNVTLACAFLAAAPGAQAADGVLRSEANSGNLLMEDVPPIPQQIVDDLNRYQNVRSATVLDWAGEGQGKDEGTPGGIYIATRFANVDQLHLVKTPGAARRQLTYYDDPIGEVARQPGGSSVVFTRDIGGSEFSQLFLLDPKGGEALMLTDGKSRNGVVLWDRRGEKLAYQSTRRNGASNDLWLMDPSDPDAAKMILESPDGMWWGAVDFSRSGSRLLIQNYVSVADSRTHLLDIDTGNLELLAGGDERISANLPLGFDAEEGGFWLITDRDGEFQQLAWQSLSPGSRPEIVTGKIAWSVDGAALSHDRARLAFVVNEGGLSRLYLMDTRSRQYRAVPGIPTGIASGLVFSPDDRQLAMTLSTPQTPSDAFVLKLGNDPLEHGALLRWTESEVGGLDTESFATPELVHYPTFDRVDGKPRQIPAWVYRPRSKRPAPVVISIHGGPEGQARPYFSYMYQMWLDRLGVAVVVPNVRGSAGYGKSYLALDNGMQREDSVRDIGALLDWIAADPGLDESRVAVYGGSYGGYMVLASAAHYSDRLRAAVDIVGISNFVTFLENTQDYRRDLRRAEYGDERRPEMRAYLEKVSPLNNVADIKVPMLVVQGQNDPRVPVTESEQMVNALRQQGRPVWYMNALNEGHGYKSKQNRDIYQQAVVLFFERHLVGDQ